jgi:hypothetical protein
MEKLDLTKPYRCRNGLEAQAFPCPDGTLVGWVKERDGAVSHEDWQGDGSYVPGSRELGHDLINVPQTRTIKVWFNVYSYEDDYIGFGNVYSTRAAADEGGIGKDRIACLQRELTFEVGEGLPPCRERGEGWTTPSTEGELE